MLINGTCCNCSYEAAAGLEDYIFFRTFGDEYGYGYSELIA